jgi:hypothetical protein
MFRLKTLAVALVAVTLISTAATATPADSVRSSARVLASARPFDLLHDGVFGCRITLNAKNEGNSPVTIKLGESKSKVRLGTWNRWGSESNWMVPADGAVKSNQVELSMPCSAGDRQYEFTMTKSGSEKIVRFPANDDFTGATTIALGNVARHF